VSYLYVERHNGSSNSLSLLSIIYLTIHNHLRYFLHHSLISVSSFLSSLLLVSTDFLFILHLKVTSSSYNQSTMSSTRLTRSGRNIDIRAEAIKVLEQIYRDYQSRFDEFKAGTYSYVSQSSWNGVMRNRCNDISSRLGDAEPYSLIFIGILARSETFIQQLHFCPDILWPALSQLLLQNKSSIEFYARSRGVDWLEAARDLIEIVYAHDHLPPAAEILLSGKFPAHFQVPLGIDDQVLHQNLYDYGPDTYYLAKDDTIKPMIAPTFVEEQPEGEQMIDIKECNYRPEDFSIPRSESWPWRVYPQHPQQCKYKESRKKDADHFMRCNTCGHRFSRPEDWGNPDLGCQCHDWCVDALVQVVEYDPYPDEPDMVNRGVRALQTFEKDLIIGEYTGELVPHNELTGRHWDVTYPFSLFDAEKTRTEIALVSARRCGNWTRFINHQFNPSKQNICFAQLLVKNRVRIIVRTLRRIEFGEEIFGYYGPDYFPEEMYEKYRDS